MTHSTAIDYGMRVHLDVAYDEAIERVTAALKDEGFGVLTQIDVKSTLKQKLDVDFRRYIILGACNPKLAHQAFTTEMEIGLLLPCNVIVYEADNGGSIVSIIDPVVLLSIGVNPELKGFGEDAATRLRRVLDALEAAA